ncbi:MAG TPA: class I SAM-dependent methyltransferase [Solirubrobacteraceae bacterium]|jgi:2-polyprenyl-3-methyl-5-hydroxy-6-metoxy-1,4-benzoquinol methylase|nr:class I SAM-dependent methyltransferase [Solirubrobacteraceae bacterium]
MSAGWSYYEDARPDVQALVNPRGLRCLDVGCGGGALAAALKAAGAAFVAGVEYDAAAAARARERLDIVVEGSVLDVQLPFAESAFDLIVFADVLEHLADPDAALRRCLPLLAPGGQVVVSVPNMRFWLILWRLAADRWEYADHGVRDRTHLRIFTRRSLLRMLDDHGLRVELLTRNRRLLDDQSQIGRAGALATRLVVATLARWPFRDLLAYQYVVVARRAA